MLLQFNPPTIALIELSEAWLSDKSVQEDLFEVINALKQIHEVEKNQFLFSIQGMKKTNNLLNMFEEIKAAFQERDEILLSLENAITLNKSDEIESLLDRIEEINIVIQQAVSVANMEDSKLRLSKYPLINSLLQAVMNVYGDLEPVEVLQPRILAAINFVKYMQTQFDLYLEIRPQAAPWQPYFLDSIENLKQGVGAIQVFLDEHNTKNLLAAAHILQENSQALFNLLEDMYEKTEKLFTFSKIPEIERLWIRRYRFSQNVIPKEDLDDAIGAVDSLIQTHELSAAAFEDSLVSEEIRLNYTESLKNYAANERVAFQNLSDDDTTLVHLKEAIELYVDTNKLVADYVEQTIPVISDAANINEFRKIILGVYTGSTPVRILRRVTEFLVQQLDSAMQEESDVPQEALELQHQGLSLVQEFLVSRDRTLLPKALDAIHKGAIQLIEYHKQKTDSELSKLEAKPIICVKCGYQNRPGVTHCEYCYSYLLFAKDPLQQKESLINYENGEPILQKPENVRKIEDLAAQIMDSEEIVNVKPIIFPILNETKSVLEFFEKRPAEAKEKDELDPAEFIQATKQYEAGLMNFLDYENDGDKSKIQAGLDMIRAAVDSFMAMKTV